MRVVLTVTRGPAQGRTFTFEEPDLFLVGRASDARISLPNDPFLSRHHFLLEIAPPRARITDLGSKNGTFVDNLRYGGRKAPEPGMQLAPDGAHSVLLNNGSEIVIGETRISVALEDGTTVFPGSQAAAETLVVPEGQRRALASAGMATLVEAPAASQANPFALPTMVSAAPPGPGLTVPPAPPPPGVQGVSFPGYRVEKVLGRGGMGIVYKAIQEKTGRPVAIKAMLPQAAASFQNFQRFHREIEVTRQLQHPNIVELLDSGRVKGGYFCVLEFVDGTDMKRLVDEQGGKLLLADAIPLMLGTLRGLAFAHRVTVQLRAAGEAREFTGIVHRDLKPENILLAKTNEGWAPKVADFGLAKSFESAGMTDMTMAGVCGTPIYWPREQITHYRYLHPATDVFSIACVFYEILTGRWARPGLEELFVAARRRNTTPQISDFMRVIGSNPIPPLRQVEPSVPIPVADVINRALTETEVPADEAKMWETLSRLRYPDAGVFGEELQVALQRSGFRV